jgi:molybdate transport system permease protein
MDWYPLYNSLRIAVISAVIVFFAGIAAAYYIARLPRLLKGVLDVVLTLPLVLPPTVVGYLLLCLLGPRRVLAHGFGRPSPCGSPCSGGRRCLQWRWWCFR